VTAAPSAAAVRERAARVGIELDDLGCARIVGHAESVLAHNAALHLTTVIDPAEILERHIGESLEGAACVDSAARGYMLDLGSGNGYPALPLASARPGLIPVLTEANRRKAAFLREVVDGFGTGTVVDRQVQRPDDVGEPRVFRVITTRALGSWERVLPRFAGCLELGGVILLWAGDDVAAVARRRAWRRLSSVGRRVLPGRDRSWIWAFQSNQDKQ
jgi:16S rRNA (guanine527-N7)-methyltransferase